MKIVIDHKIPFIQGVFENLAEVVYLPGNAITADEVKDADALIVRTRTKCNAVLLKDSAVRFIATATIGYDHIDTAYCKEVGIEWANAPGCNSASVEQYVVSAILHLAGMLNLSLTDLTVGIVGVGNVGTKVDRALRSAGCKTLLNDPPRAASEGPDGFTDMGQLLQQSDVVTMHVPLSSGGKYPTEGMVSGEFFSQMKHGTIFINTSRGEVVDESALKSAITSGMVSATVLDVYRNEPAVDMDLLGIVSLATPHIAGYSTDGKANGTMMSVQSVSKFFNLGLNDWRPVNIPHPGNQEILLDASEGDRLAMISNAYQATYDIDSDHKRFLSDPSQFEKLRGDYPLRREPSSYSIRLFNDDGLYRNIFEGLGFNVLADTCM